MVDGSTGVTIRVSNAVEQLEKIWWHKVSNIDQLELVIWIMLLVISQLGISISWISRFLSNIIALILTPPLTPSQVSKLHVDRGGDLGLFLLDKIPF